MRKTEALKPYNFFLEHLLIKLLILLLFLFRSLGRCQIKTGCVREGDDDMLNQLKERVIMQES